MSFKTYSFSHWLDKFISDSISKLIWILLNNPRLFIRMGLLKIKKSFIKTPKTMTIIAKFGDINFPINFSLTHGLIDLYIKKYELDVITVMEKYLKPGDVFIDIGANIGYFSALALELVGISGQVHAFEPVPKYYANLDYMHNLNPKFAFFPNNVALSDTCGNAMIDVFGTENIGWNTMVPNFMKNAPCKETITVDMVSFDEYSYHHHLNRVKMIKIDVEGYEIRVLKGMERFLSNVIDKPIIICEILFSAYPFLNSSIEDLESFLTKHHYRVVNTYNTIKCEKLAELNKHCGKVKNSNFLFLPY